MNDNSRLESAGVGAEPAGESDTRNSEIRRPPSLLRARRTTAVFYLFAASLIVGLTTAAIVADYRYAYRQAQTLTSTLATALEEHVVRTLLDADRMLSHLQEHVQDEGGIVGISPDRAFAVVKEYADTTPQVESLFILNADGSVLASSLEFPVRPIDLSHREYFQYHARSLHPDLYVGRRVQSPLTGEQLFTATRSMYAADNSFEGVLGAAIATDYFQRFYERLKLPENTAILITRRDGQLLFRYPAPHTDVEDDNLSDMALFREQLPRSPEGTYEAFSQLDNLTRIVSYRSLADLPFVVALSMPREVALEIWRERSVQRALVAVIMILVLTWLSAGILRQLNRAERAEGALSASRARFEELATLSTDGFWEQDEQHRFTWLGEGFRSTLGSASDLFAGKAPWELPVTNLTDADWDHHRRVLANRLPYRDLVLKIGLANGAIWLSVSGNPALDSRGNLTGYFGTARQVTEEMEQRAEIVRQAFHDPLTRLPNRALFQDRLVQAMAKARRNDTRPAVLFIDLDRFKQINDVHGHHVGDRLLAAVAERLSACLRESDTVARYGGDEFVVLLTDLSDKNGAVRVARKLLESISGPYEIEGVSLQITPSIGGAVFSDDGDTAEQLQRAADEAMYRVKAAGRAGIAFAGDDS